LPSAFALLAVALITLALVFWLVPTENETTTTTETSTSKVFQPGASNPKTTNTTKNTETRGPGTARSDTVLALLLGTGALLVLVASFWGRIQEIGLPGGGSIKLQDAEAPQPPVDLDNVAVGLRGMLAQATGERQVAATMTSGSASIITTAKDLSAQGTGAIPVDLGVGDKWVLPNLYFLALVLERWTRVDVVVFTHTDGQRTGIYVACTSPEALRLRIGVARPEFETAAQSTRDGSLNAAGGMFFNQLGQQLQARAAPTAPDTPPEWVDANNLLELARGALTQDSVEIEPDDAIPIDAIRAILAFPQPFVPLTRLDKQLVSIADQNKVALKLARRAIP
jgi:hypothetical protein